MSYPSITARPDPWTPEEHERMLAAISARLWLFTRPYARVEQGIYQIVGRLTNLQPDDLHRLRAIHYLLRPELLLLLNEDVPAILRRMAGASVQIPEITHAAIRGRIDWSRTLAERTAAGYADPSLYAVQATTRHFDLAPNQVLKALLEAIRVLAQEVSRGQFNAGAPVQPEQDSTWLHQIAAIRMLCETYLKHVHMRAVSLPAAVTGSMLQATRAARNPAYRRVESLYRQYLELVEYPDLLPSEAVLREQILRPLDPDTIYELAILFATLDTLEAHGWRPLRLRLIGATEQSKPVAAYRHPGYGLMRVYYQQIPKAWRKLSAYTGIFDKYALGTATRRPDIILHWHSPRGLERSMIVEVKRSANRHYLAESAYKVLGYLKDFALAFAAHDPSLQVPAAILAAWDGASPLPEVSSEALLQDEVLLTTYTGYTPHLNTILARIEASA